MMGPVLASTVALAGEEPQGRSEALAPDRALVARAQEGHRDAFDALVLRHAGSLRNVIIHHGVTGVDVDDVLQEVFLRAYRGLAKFKGDASFGTWLYRIAFTVVIDRERRRRRRPQVSEPLDPKDSERQGDRYHDTRRNPEETALGEAEVRMVRLALQEVEPLFRQILILREMEGLSYQEIADSLQIAEGTVKSRLARARAQLKDILETKHGW